MCYDVIPLVCSDWCILAASFCTRARWGNRERKVNGLNFPKIETSKCEQSPAWGRVRALSNVLNSCNIVNVLFLMSCLPVKASSFLSVHKQNSNAFAGLIRTQRGKGPDLIIYVYSTFTMSSVTYQGRSGWRREGGREGDERRMRILWVEDEVFLRYSCRHAVMSSAGSPHSLVSRPRQLQWLNHKMLSYFCAQIYLSEGRYSWKTLPLRSYSHCGFSHRLCICEFFNFLKCFVNDLYIEVLKKRHTLFIS